uniref:Uncharacterized protein n=1 Tax=Eutreptiella gymnastica TaxID=73025 RepID=A0A7S1N221_9EUGL
MLPLISKDGPCYVLCARFASSCVGWDKLCRLTNLQGVATLIIHLFEPCNPATVQLYSNFGRGGGNATQEGGAYGYEYNNIIRTHGSMENPYHALVTPTVLFSPRSSFAYLKLALCLNCVLHQVLIISR